MSETKETVEKGLAELLAAEQQARRDAEARLAEAETELANLKRQVRIARTMSQSVADSLDAAARVMELPL